MVKLDIREFLKGEDIVGDTAITFVDEGANSEIPQSDGKPSIPTFEIGVELPNKELKTWTINKTSQKTLASVFGKDTSKWVSKIATLFVMEQNVRGAIKQVIYARTPVKQ